MPIIVFLVYTVGLALFQANAIQFGLDQLLEAPTPKLISFIHWYYWAQNVGSLVFFYVVVSGFYIVDVTDKEINGTISKFLNGNVDYTVFVCFLIAMSIAVTVVLIKFCSTKKHFYIQKVGLNPFKNIYNVLKYSLKHKVPEHRSAFTYWEEDIPRRIDFGKSKYGGPFTNEEVEDTKTFLRILPLLLCLFGYHLAGDGYSAPEQLQRTSCPSLPVLLLIVYNPLHMSTLVSVVGIPLYRLVIVKVFPRVKNIRMLTKMWMGLYLSLLQVVLYIIVVVSHDTTYWQQHHTVIPYETQYPSTRKCYIIRTGCDQLRRGSHTWKLISFHPLVLLGSECWQFGILLLLFLYGVDYKQSVAVLVVKDSWSSGAVLEQSSHLLLDGIQTDTGGVVGCVGMS